MTSATIGQPTHSIMPTIITTYSHVAKVVTAFLQLGLFVIIYLLLFIYYYLLSSYFKSIGSVELLDHPDRPTDDTVVVNAAASIVANTNMKHTQIRYSIFTYLLISICKYNTNIKQTNRFFYEI
jgi:hypothetical protein